MTMLKERLDRQCLQVVKPKLSKRMKAIFLCFCFITVVGCKNTYNLKQVVNGTWGLYQVEYGLKNESLLYEDKGSDFVFGAPLYFDMTSGFMHLDLDTDYRIKAQFIFNFKKKKKTLKIFNATDERFNGDYQIWIDTVSMNPYRDKYKILLESDSIFMVGTKTIVKKI